MHAGCVTAATRLQHVRSITPFRQLHRVLTPNYQRELRIKLLARAVDVCRMLVALSTLMVLPYFLFRVLFVGSGRR